MYVIRNPEVLKQLRDRHLHAEEENSRGPSKREYSYASYWDGFEQKSSTGTWVKDGVSVGIAPLSGKWRDLILGSALTGRATDHHELQGEKNLVDQIPTRSQGGD